MPTFPITGTYPGSAYAILGLPAGSPLRLWRDASDPAIVRVFGFPDGVEETHIGDAVEADVAAAIPYATLAFGAGGEPLVEIP